MTLDVPMGVTTMIDAGAVFKLRGSRIGVGSSNLNINRSGGALQVLGATCYWTPTEIHSAMPPVPMQRDAFTLLRGLMRLLVLTLILQLPHLRQATGVGSLSVATWTPPLADRISRIKGYS